MSFWLGIKCNVCGRSGGEIKIKGRLRMRGELWDWMEKSGWRRLPREEHACGDCVQPKQEASAAP